VAVCGPFAIGDSLWITGFERLVYTFAPRRPAASVFVGRVP
jgi:hypothetical protein